MALIKCPECGQEISDTTKTCPKCGSLNLISHLKSARFDNWFVFGVSLFCAIVIMFFAFEFAFTINVFKLASLGANPSTELILLIDALLEKLIQYDGLLAIISITFLGFGIFSLISAIRIGRYIRKIKT